MPNDINNQDAAPQQHEFMGRTRIRVVRSDGREWPSMAIAYRELIGTAQEIGSSEHQRMRTALRGGLEPRDRRGFTWTSVGGLVAEATIAWTDFTFGVELELVAREDMYELSRNLSSAGFNGWSVVRDGSLSATTGWYASEVVSPVLQGVAGLEKLRKVMEWLEAHGCRINNTCGMHVHVGVRGMKVSRLRKIAIAFVNAEQHFDALVPQSRRNNRYAQSNRSRVTGTAARQRLTEAASISALGEVLNGGNSREHYNSYRYHKLNFQSFVRHGTIEFRQHSGTVEAEKATQWVRLLTGFCAAAASAEQQTVLNGQMDFDSFIQRSTDEAGVRFMNARRAKFAAAEARAAA